MKDRRFAGLMFTYLATSIWSSFSMANSFPDEFLDFFVETPQSIQVSIAGDRDGETLVAQVNYDTFRLAEGTQGYQEFSSFLERKGLRASVIDRILRDARQGIETDSGCEGRLSRCVLDISDGQNKYVFDFDESRLRIVVTADALRNDLEAASYESPLNVHNALVNWSNVYAQTDLSGREQLTFNNQTTLGLPLGYISTDTEYISRNEEFHVYTALYDMEYQNTRFVVGRNRYNTSFNSADYLNSGARYAGELAQVGSSANLLRGQGAAQQRIYFYAPENGQLEVYRDERLILNRSVTEGQQHISYAELPKGAYQITVILKVQGQAVLTETRQVVNNHQFSLLTGELDYVFGVGRFESQEGFEDEPDYEDFRREYMRGTLNYRAFERWMLGGGVTAAQDAQLYHLGTRYMLCSDATLEYVIGLFDNQDRYHTARLGYAPFFAEYQQLALNDDDTFSLSNQLYGRDDYQNVGIGLSGYVMGGHSYLRYSWNEYQGSSARDYRSQGINAGWSYRLPHGQLSLSADWRDSDQYASEFRSTLSYTLELGSGVSYQFGMYGNSDGFDSSVNYLRAENHWNDWYANTSVGTRIDRETQIGSDLSTSFSGRNTYFNANGYGHVSDEGHKSLSGSMSGTQIISSQGVDFTSERGRSFVLVQQQNEVGDEQIYLNTVRDGRYRRRQTLTDEKMLLKMDEFTRLQLSVEQSGSNTLVEEGRVDGFAFPGSVYGMRSQIIKLDSQLFVLDDVNGEPISSLQCVGEGCVGVEPVTDDGIFRVNVKPGSDYRLVSRKGLCVYDLDKAQEDFIHGYCLPGIEQGEDENWQNSAALLEQIESQDVLVYLGRFHYGSEVDAVTQQLEQLSITYKSIEVGRDIYVYLVEGQEFTQAQRELLQSLDAYVLHRETEIDLLTIRRK